MKLVGMDQLGSGQLVGTAATLTRPDGSTLTLPVPMYLLDQDIAAVVVFRVNELDQLVADLDRWALRDLARDRSTGLTISGSPAADAVSRMAARYVREARGMPQHELSDWANRVISEPSM